MPPLFDLMEPRNTRWLILKMALSVNAVYFKSHLDEFCEISLKTEMKHHLINKILFLKIHLFWNPAFMQEIKWISWKLSQTSTSNHHAEFSPYSIKTADQWTNIFQSYLVMPFSWNFWGLWISLSFFLSHLSISREKTLCYSLNLHSSLPVNSNILCFFRSNTMDF